MNIVKSILAWAKQNLVIVICGAVAVLALAMLFVAHLTGKGVSERAAQVNSQISQYASWKRKTVQLPTIDPNVQQEPLYVPPNVEALSEVKSYFTKMGAQITAMRDAAELHNRFGVTASPRYGEAATTGHQPLLPGLFPKLTGTTSLPFQAARTYRDIFVRMLGPYEEDSLYPNLDSGMPQSDQELQESLQRHEAEITGSRDKVSAEQMAEMRRNERMRLRVNLANRIHIYATQPVPTGNEMDFGVDSAFDVGSWSSLTTRGSSVAGRAQITAEQMWRGQTNLWIQQDIAEAIARLNQVDDPTVNVLTAPIKRLVSIRVIPYYIGAESEGAIASSLTGVPTATALAAGDSYYRFGGGSRPPDPTMMAGNMDTGMPPAPSTWAKKFAAAPTGRVSNELFDVWHAVVTVDIDSQAIPAFFNTLAEVNFITPLNVRIEPVDEYELLQQGFVYGSSDVVRLTVYLETLWLRSWTEPLMPDEIKQKLGLATAQPESGMNGAEAPAAAE